MSFYLPATEVVKREILTNFDNKLKMNERIRVIADQEMFKASEDKFVWGQKEGKIPNYYQVYLDGEFINGFFENNSMPTIMTGFWKGLKKAYESGLVRLTPRTTIDDEIEQQEKKDREDASAKAKLKRKKATTPVERMAKEIVGKVIDAK